MLLTRCSGFGLSTVGCPVVMAQPPWRSAAVDNGYVAAVWSAFGNYGWFILFGLIAIYILAQNLSRKFRKLQSPPPAYDPDAVAKREEAMMAARLKMQAEIDAQAEIFKAKQKEREEEKRKQKIAKWESMKEGSSYKMTLQHNPADEPDPGPSTSGSAQKPKSEKRTLRSGGYNPLSGEGGGSCTWRPGRRGPSSGG